MRITVAGIGYVGLSNAVLLSQHNKVTAFDINTDRVDMINKKISPIVDKDVSEYLANKNLLGQNYPIIKNCNRQNMSRGKA